MTNLPARLRRWLRWPRRKRPGVLLDNERPVLCSWHPTFWGKMRQLAGPKYEGQHPVSYVMCEECKRMWGEGIRR